MALEACRGVLMVVPYYSDDLTTLYLGSAEDILPTIEDGSVHLVATDPPYFRVIDSEWDNQWGPDANKFLAWMGEIFIHFDRTLADRGTLAVFCSPDLSAAVEMKARERFAVLNHIVWRKPAPGRLGMMDKSALRRFFPTSERIIFAEKARNPDGDLMRFRDTVNHQVARDVYATIRETLCEARDRAGLTNREVDAALGTSGMSGHYFGASQWTLPTEEAWRIISSLIEERGVTAPTYEMLRGEFDARRGEFDARRREFDARRSIELMSDVWTFDTVPPSARYGGHPTQKPLGLMIHIIETTSRKGDTVLDAFAGTSTTLRAAKDMGRKSIGIEKDERYCEAAAKRLAQETLF